MTDGVIFSSFACVCIDRGEGKYYEDMGETM